MLHITGSGNDTLNVLGPVIATTFDGGSGTNTLVGPSNSSLTTWTVSGVNSGKLDGVAFSDFQNLVGGDASNLFKFTSTASISGFIDGGGGTNNNNEISYATLSSSYLVSVTLTSNTAGSATHIGGGFRNINSLLGSSDTGNTLVTGPDSTNEWIITGNNAGDVNTGPIRPFVFTASAIWSAAPESIPSGCTAPAARCAASTAAALQPAKAIG